MMSVRIEESKLVRCGLKARLNLTDYIGFPARFVASPVVLTNASMRGGQESALKLRISRLGLDLTKRLNCEPATVKHFGVHNFDRIASHQRASDAVKTIPQAKS